MEPEFRSNISQIWTRKRFQQFHKALRASPRLEKNSQEPTAFMEQLGNSLSVLIIFKLSLVRFLCLIQWLWGPPGEIRDGRRPSVALAGSHFTTNNPTLHLFYIKFHSKKWFCYRKRRWSGLTFLFSVKQILSPLQSYKMGSLSNSFRKRCQRCPLLGGKFFSVSGLVPLAHLSMVRHLLHNIHPVFSEYYYFILYYSATPLFSLLQAKLILLLFIPFYRSHFPTFQSSL